MFNNLLVVAVLLLCQNCISVLAADGDYTYLNCYGGIPSSFVLDNTYAYQTSLYCYNQCSGKGYSYFALFDHSQCYCGNVNPASSESVTDTCDATCYGYGAEFCGGTNAYSVYQIGSGQAASSNSQSSSVSSGTTANGNFGSTTVGNANTLSSNSGVTSTLSPLQSDLAVPATSASSSSLTSSSNSNNIAVVVPGSSSSSSGSSGSESASAAITGSTSVIFSTAYHTQSGSTIFVTNTITQVPSASSNASASSSLDSANGKNSNSNKKSKVGPIVGGVVGGVGGAIVCTVIVLFIIRHVNQKREEERMEKEYQEAIKPVEYSNNSVLSKTTNDHINPSSNNYGTDFYSSSVSSHHNLASSDNEIENAQEAQNPFDDSRRISLGSLTNGLDNSKKLTLANPDEGD